MPSAIFASEALLKFSRRVERMGSPIQKGSPGTKATFSAKAADKSRVASISSGRRTQRNIPPSGRVQVQPSGMYWVSAASMALRRRA